ncbi:MAG: hypothetical protein IBX52_07220 [Bacterioplanes sp.]|nr:hypothetical protein [Bacterioplanes sp.]
MEWSWRTVLILLGLLAVVLILVDGYRRMRRARQDQLRLDVRGEYHFPDEPQNPELLGRARVVSPRQREDDALPDDLPPLSSREDDLAFTADPHRASPTDTQPAPIDPSTTAPIGALGTQPEVASATLSVKDFLTPLSATAPATDGVDPVMPVSQVQNAESADALPESVSDNKQERREQVVSDEYSAVVNDTVNEAVAEEVAETDSADVPDPYDLPPLTPEPEQETIATVSVIPKPQPVNLDESVPVLLDVDELGDEIVSAPRVVNPSAVTPSTAGVKTDVMSDAAPVKSELGDEPESVPDNAFDPYPEVESVDEIDDPHLEDEVDEVPPHDAQIVNYAGDQAERLADRPEPELVLVIHALARDLEGFRGRDVLFLFNSCDLRFGEKHIFHRFELADGQGCVQFSVAQTHEPGVFDPSQMATSRYHGLSFFLSLPGAHKPLDAYEAMSEMAMVLSRNLGADLLDGEHSALTPQTMEHDRQQIIDFERRRRILQKRQGR